MDDNIKNCIAIVLCAGFGKRLNPVTKVIPKIAFPVSGKALGWNVISQLFEMGLTEVHCNVHHLSHTVQTILKKEHYNSTHKNKLLHFWQEVDILETGGGIANILHGLVAIHGSNIWKKKVFIVSGDIFAYCPLNEFLKYWEHLATPLALMSSLKVNSLRADNMAVDPGNSRVIGFGSIDPQLINHISPDQLRLFTNHQLILASLLKDVLISRISSVKMIYQPLIEQGKPLYNFEWKTEWAWHNVGTWDEFDTANRNSPLINSKIKGNFGFSDPICFLYLGSFFSLSSDQSWELFGKYMLVRLPYSLNEYPDLLFSIKKLSKIKKTSLHNLNSIPNEGHLFYVTCSKTLALSLDLPFSWEQFPQVIIDFRLLTEDSCNSEQVSGKVILLDFQGTSCS